MQPAAKFKGFENAHVIWQLWGEVYWIICDDRLYQCGNKFDCLEKKQQCSDQFTQHELRSLSPLLTCEPRLLLQNTIWH
jgi:hypothetical protein